MSRANLQLQWSLANLQPSSSKKRCASAVASCCRCVVKATKDSQAIHRGNAHTTVL